MINKEEEKPGYVKALMEKSGTNKVAKYKVTTLEIQRKVPKVIRLKGRSKRLIRGFISISTAVKAAAPNASVTKLSL